MKRGAAIISVVVALASHRATPASAQASASASQSPALGAVSGYVVDAHGQPIPGARVLARGTPRMATTGAHGEYRMDSVPPGHRMIRVRAPHYAALDVVLVVPSADVADLDVRLDSAAAPADSLAPPDAPDLRHRAATKPSFVFFVTRPELDDRRLRVLTEYLRGHPFVVGRDGNAWSIGTTSGHAVVARVEVLRTEDVQRLMHSPAERGATFTPRDECGHAWPAVLDGVPLDPGYRLDDIPVELVSAIEVRLPVVHAFETPYGPESPACGLVFVYSR